MPIAIDFAISIKCVPEPILRWNLQLRDELTAWLINHPNRGSGAGIFGNVQSYQAIALGHLQTAISTLDTEQQQLWVKAESVKSRPLSFPCMMCMMMIGVLRDARTTAIVFAISDSDRAH